MWYFYLLKPPDLCPMTISVCIVDDNKDIRSALEQIILMAEGYTLAGSFSDAEEALQKIPLVKPNVVLMDINLGDGESGIDCVRQLKPQNPEILFMMCTIYEEDEKIFEALKAEFKFQPCCVFHDQLTRCAHLFGSFS